MPHFIGATAVALCLFTGTTFAAVVTDGTVNPLEYTTTVTDIDVPAEAVDYAGTGLDILSIGLDFADETLRVGVDTAATFDYDGNSFPGIADRTLFSMIFLDGPVPIVEISVVTFGPSTYAVLMTDPLGFIPTNITLAPGVVVNYTNDLELAIPLALLPNSSAIMVAFSAQLDGQDEARDDVLFGSNIPVPEPASAALLALGGLAIARRRRA